MSDLKLVQSAPAVQSALSGFTEAERGDVKALGVLLAKAIAQNGYDRYRQALQGGITQASEEANTLPAERLNWRHLAALEVEQGEVASLRAWEDVKEAARQELASGHRAASVMEAGESSPMVRARFLVLREALSAEWRPVNGIEWQLIDQMTQAATAQSYWMKKLTERTQQEAAEDLRDRQKLHETQRKSEEELRRDQVYRWGEWLPERITTAEAIAEAMGMVDRWNRVFLRCLRQLRDLRRYNVTINSPAQVNIADRQINTIPKTELPKKARRRKGQAQSAL